MIDQGRLEPATFRMRGGRANHCTTFLTHFHAYRNPTQWKPNPDPIFTSDQFSYTGYIAGIGLGSLLTTCP